MEILHVGIDSWIIQDGNYSDFRVGEAAKFALEFYPQSIEASHERQVSRDHLFGSRYRVCCKVIYTAKNVWVVDFGFMAYQNQPPPRVASKSKWLQAEIYVGIDPFFYFEELHALPNMPSLKYDFRIREILVETTPWLTSKDGQERTILTRDESRRSFTPVAETNAWGDDQGHAHYILECEPIGS